MVCFCTTAGKPVFHFGILVYWVARQLNPMGCCRRYTEAVQELSICVAFAPEEEAEILEPFVEKLHLLRLLASWECLDSVGTIPVS